MRLVSLLYPLLTASIISLSSAAENQAPIMNNPGLGPVIPLPDTDVPPSVVPPSGGDTVIITDVIGRDRSINIFAGFTRDVESVDDRLGDETVNTTVLAPVNSAIVALSRKPWEDPEDYSRLGPNAYEGESGEERAQANLRRFVEAHILPQSPWEEGDKVETLVGSKIWWEMKDGKKVIHPGNIEVTSVAGKVANGEVWILKGTLNYARKMS